MTNLDMLKDVAKQWTSLVKNMESDSSMLDYCKGTLDGLISAINIIENKKIEGEE